MLADSVEGSHVARFRLIHWVQLVSAGAIVGSSFLWTEIALRSFSPVLIAFGRVAIGAIALGVIPSARAPVRRVDWPQLGVASLLAIATPNVLFAIAQQRIPSALAGMLLSAIPLMTGVVVAIETRSWPTRTRLVGLLVGFSGVVLLSTPYLAELGAEATGVAMVLAAVLAVAIGTTVYAPLQQTYDSVRVTFWVLVVSSLMLTPPAILGLSPSSLEPLPFAALLILGVASTGIVLVLLVELTGNVGAVRASLSGYIIPIVAVVLGVVVLNEQIEFIQIAGVIVALLGGYLVSRGT